ncbi:hypothetical protein Ancab_008466 [Ancistrocladus abbreviatus]
MGRAILLLLFLVILIIRTNGSLYRVGDTSGWDISTDLDSWVLGKRFVVGDVLLFQYSSYHSVAELTRQDYNGCNTTNALQTYTGGNTSIPLTKAGGWYFACGNKLHCLGGMKLQVHVASNQAPSPAPAPQQGGGGSLPKTSKNNNPLSTLPSSSPSLAHASAPFFLLVLCIVGLLQLDQFYE